MTREASALVEAPRLSVEDQRLVEGLQAGDEDAFTELVRRHHSSMVRFATLYVPSRAVAEEVAQETWLSVFRAIDRFEGRSSLRTWVFTILVNCAKKRGEREARTVPFASLGEPGLDPVDGGLDEDSFFAAGHRWAGAWTTAVDGWEGIPDDRLLGREALAMIETAIDALPHAQAQVMKLRDVEGWPAEDVCNFLAISNSNQRVLLHRARSKVRRAVEAYFAQHGASC